MMVLKAWIKEQGHDEPLFLFPNRNGGRLSADAVQHAVAKHADAAQRTCPSLAKKHVTPHVLRHTAAMELLKGDQAAFLSLPTTAFTASPRSCVAVGRLARIQLA